MFFAAQKSELSLLELELHAMNNHLQVPRRNNLVVLLFLFLVCGAPACVAQASRNFASDPYEILAVYRLPHIVELSGISVVSKNNDTVRCVGVSDKRPHLYEFFVPIPAQIDQQERALSARILRTIDGAEDLEGVAYFDNGAWVSSEIQGSRGCKIYYVPFNPKQPIRSYEVDSISVENNNGAECLAVVPVNGVNELWIGKERFLSLDRSPPIFRFTCDSALLYRGKVSIDYSLHRTQSGMAYNPADQTVWVVSRELRTLMGISLPQSSGSVRPLPTSFSYEWDHFLRSSSPFGIVEGISFDQDGICFVAVDNNGTRIGPQGSPMTTDSRVLVLRRKR